MTLIVSELVGFIGVGSMGGPMVERLLTAGVQVHLYVRRPEVAERFAALGATIEESVADVAGSAPIVFVCPFNESQVEEILLGEGGVYSAAAPGTVVVQHATISPECVARLSAEADERGIDFLDAPVSGRAEEIAAGQLTVLVGGPTAAADLAAPALSTYCGTITKTGGSGSATLLKLVNNLMFAAQVQVAGAGVAMLNELGLEIPAGLAALNSCSARSFALAVLQSLGGDLDAFATAAAPYLSKDVALAEAALAAAGVTTGQLSDVVRNGTFDLVSSTKESIS